MAEPTVKTSAGNETATQTVDRINTARAGATSNTSTTSSDAFAKESQNRLLGQANIVSSTDTQLEDTFRSAKESIVQGQQASAARIESAFGRAQGQAVDSAQSQFDNIVVEWKKGEERNYLRI